MPLSNFFGSEGWLRDKASPLIGRLETVIIYNPSALLSAFSSGGSGPLSSHGIGGVLSGTAAGAAIGGGISGGKGALFGAGIGASAAIAGQGTSIGNIIGGIGEVASSEDILFRFRINPQSFKQNESKIRQFEKTQRGWETSYGGEQMIKLSFNGTTGALIPPSFVRKILGLDDVRLSLPYWNLCRFNKFFEVCDRRGDRLHMIFWGKLFVGHLMSFSYGLNADDPKQIKYDFTFNAYPGKIRGLTSIFPEWLRGILNMTEFYSNLGSQINAGLDTGFW